MAVGAEKGSLKFAGESAYGHLIPDDGKGTMDHGTSVNVTTIDDVVTSLALDRVDFIKIDVEGFEEDVLRGGRKTEKKFTPLYFAEFNSFCISAYAQKNPIDLARYILEHFESVFLVHGDGRLEKKTEPVDLLHENIVHSGSVSNLLMTNSSERLKLKSSVEVTELSSPT